MNDLSMTISDRDVRQRALAPLERLARCDAIVIGVGAIGRQVAIQLAALGISRLTLFDDDAVEPASLAPQSYWPEDLNCSKVSAASQLSLNQKLLGGNGIGYR